MSEYEFHGQKEGEEVVLAVKQSPAVFVSLFFKVLLWWLPEIVLFILSLLITWQIINIILSYYFYLALAVGLYLFATGWYKWANTVYLITNERIIAAEQKSWFSRLISEATLENILFISHKVEGPLQTMLNFGSIHINASGVIEEEMVLANIPDPYEVQQQVVSEQRKITGKQAAVYSEQSRDTNKKEPENQNFWSENKKRPLIK